MSHLLYVVPALACPIAMGLMMWLMMRGHQSTEPRTPTTTQGDEIARLRAEIDELRGRQAGASEPTTHKH